MKALKYWPVYRKFIQWANRNFPVTICKMRFRKYFGRKMNLKNPQDINEKISWLELFSDTSLWTKCTDKYAVREYVKNCGLENILVKLYGKWDNANEIDWKNLPQQLILKTNNGSGTVLVIEDKNNINIEEVSIKFNKMLHQFNNLSTTEFHYQGIRPCIVAEELLISDDEERKWSTSIIDYKIWCFNGKVDSIWTCSNRNSYSTEVALFDRDWNYRPEASVFNEHYKKQEHLTPRPDCLEELIEVAEKLSAPFPVVRVDLYIVRGKIYFGELTFTSLGGTIDFYTTEELLRMGQKIDISNVKKIR